MTDLIPGGGGLGPSGHKDHVQPIGDIRREKAESLPHAPFDPVALHGISDLFADRKTGAGKRTPVGLNVQDRQTVDYRLTLLENVLKFFVLLQSLRGSSPLKKRSPALEKCGRRPIPLVVSENYALMRTRPLARRL